jgi:metallo-beta-lactamase family protein
VTYVRDFEESTLLATRPGSGVIVAASGMCDAGRIQHHLKMLVDDPRCSIVLVSFQASGTVGRKLLEPRPTVRFQGRDWNKWIEVHHLDGFSGHADKDDFVAYLAPLAGRIEKVRLIHGEREQAEALAGTLRELGFADVAVPAPGDRVVIG